VTDVLETAYSGIVVSDIYGGYNTHLGLHGYGFKCVAGRLRA
jgi:hypothetical protein